MTPLLYYQSFGEAGPIIVILHGLFGSSKNWLSIARQLSSQYRILLPDARNHGQSFHHPEHTIPAMVADLQQLLQHLKIQRPVLLGHSMGGLTAMHYALSYPENTAALIVVDIAPRAYHNKFEREFAALNLDLSSFQSRQAIDTALQPLLPDTAVRQFLQTNIQATPEGTYRWVLNVPVLQQAEKRADPQLPEAIFKGPTLFLRSLKEEFITEQDLPLIFKYFPNAQILNFTTGNHWLHITEPGFLPAVQDFLSKYCSS